MYNLVFLPNAKKAWLKLDPSVRNKIEKTLERRLQNPFIESAALSGDLAGCYKIKSKSSGIRLIYKVTESNLILLVITVGKREGGESYDDARAELDNIKDES